MKPEELDRLFRDELEKLDQIPGIEWNEDSAWDKLKSQLKGGWGSTSTWTLSIIALIVSVGYLYFSLNQKTTSISPEVKLKEKTIIVKADSARKIEETIIPKSTEKRDKVKVSNSLIKTKDSTFTSSLDTIPLSASQENNIKLKSNTIVQRDATKKTSSTQPDFSFKMPEMTLFRLKVNNNFNVSNLVKSVEAEKNAGDNFYYFYEYDKQFVPPPYGNTYQKNAFGNTQIQTNFSK